jgi:hypothetical protein
MQNTGSAEFGRAPAAILERFHETRDTFVSPRVARG